MSKLIRTAAVAMAGMVLSGCVLAPRGTAEEEARLAKAGEVYEKPVEKRELPQLGPEPTWGEILQYAFLANGEIEAGYYEWKAAVARIPMSATWPNTNLSLGFEYMFSKERMKSWDRTTLSIQPDPMSNLQFPTKTAQAGKVAYDLARAAGQKFEAMKFDMQRKVLAAYYDYALMAEQVRIVRENVALLKQVAQLAADRVEANRAPLQDQLKAQIQHRLAENELATMQTQLESMRAMLNTMIGRKPDARLDPPTTLPSPRPAPADDARLIAIAVDLNPEMRSFAAQVQGRRDALELARMAYIPDINPNFSATGSLSQALGAMVSLPTALPMIRGAIDESRAMLKESEAMLRQKRTDRAGQVVAAMVGARNAERQVQFFQSSVLPKAQQALASSRQAYSAGTISFIELVDSQRTLLDIRRMLAEAKIAREKFLAELECLICVDLETLGPAATTRPATAPATRAASGSSQYGSMGVWEYGGADGAQAAAVSSYSHTPTLPHSHTTRN